jgi:hypothetical protein
LVAQVQLGSKPGTLDILVKIDHTAISFESQQDRWAGRLDILFVQKDDRGNQFNGLEDTVELRLIQANYERLMKEDLIYHKVVDRSPSAKVLRIVVRDAASGSLGSVTVPLATGGAGNPACSRLSSRLVGLKRQPRSRLTEIWHSASCIGNKKSGGSTPATV